MRLFDSNFSAAMAGLLFAFVYSLAIAFSFAGAYCLWPIPTEPSTSLSLLQQVCSTAGYFGAVLVLVVGLVMLLNMTFLMCFICWTWCCASSKRAEARKRSYAAINIGSTVYRV